MSTLDGRRDFLIVAGSEQEQHEIERLGLSTPPGADRLVVISIRSVPDDRLRGRLVAGYALTRWAREQDTYERISSTLRWLQEMSAGERRQ